MKIFKTANYLKFSKNKEDNFKDVKHPKNNRGQWSANDNFNQKLEEEFSGYSDKKKDDEYSDKWKQLMEKHKKTASIIE